MVPIVKTLLDVEMIRDGGSLAASFLDEDRAEWILFLKLDQVCHEDRLERLGFKRALLD